MLCVNAKLFGTPSISVDGREITLPYKKAAALLYYLLLKRRASRGELIALLYADFKAADSLRNLRHAIFSIRQAFGADPFVAKQRDMVEFSPDISISCDVYDFQHGSFAAYSGEFLSGFNLSHADAFDFWLADQRTFFQAQYQRHLLSALADAYRVGNLAEAEKYGLDCIAIDPLEENAYSVLMRVYRDQGSFRKAIGLYHTLCKNLSDELNIAPLKETSALYYQIVDAWNHSTFRIENNDEQSLIGKSRALRRLVSLCNISRRDDDISCILLQGKSGVGKTHLVNYILSQYDFSGWIVCKAACYQSETHNAFVPWNSIMLDLLSNLEHTDINIPKIHRSIASGIFPCLSVEPTLGLSGGSDLSDIYSRTIDYMSAVESALLIFSTIAKKSPILFVLEDIHWIDNNSADFLSALLHRLHSANITVICTGRDILPDYMQSTVQHAVSDRLLEVCPVSAFTENETAGFVNFYAPGQYSQLEIEQLHQCTGGNALFLVQLLKSLSEADNVQSFPHNADSIIQLRLNSLSAEERRLLDIVSIFPQRTPFDMLTSLLSKAPLDILYLCDYLKQKNILSEVTHNNVLYYSFTHERIKTALQELQSESDRHILHLRAAQYLESKLEDGAYSSYSQLVRHFTLGGDGFKAFKYKVLSLDSFASMCFELMPTLTNSSTAQAFQENGLTGYFQSLEHELATLHTTQVNVRELDQLERKLLYAESRYYIHHGEYERGLSILDRLLASSLSAEDWNMIVGAHLQYIYYAVQTYNRPVMSEHLKSSMEYREQLMGSAEWGNLLRLQGLFCLINGNYEECRSWMEQSIQYFKALDAQNVGLNSIRIAGAYNYIAETYRLTENYSLAIHYSDKAVYYNKQCGDYPGAAIIYTDYGVTAYQSGSRELSKELFSYAEQLYQAFHEYSQMPIALSYLALFDTEEGDYISAAVRLNKAFSVSQQIKSPWWFGITLYNAWSIRMLLEKRDITFPALSALWPSDKREHCRLCLENLHRLEPRRETEDMEAIYKNLS